MSTFSEAELAYLHGERRLDRVATVGPMIRIHPDRVVSWCVGGGGDR
jgi:hypothetical protein